MDGPSQERLWKTLGRIEQKQDAQLEAHKEILRRVHKLEGWRRNVTLVSLAPFIALTWLLNRFGIHL